MNGCQIFGRFNFLETESEPNFGFLHIPSRFSNLFLWLMLQMKMNI